MKRTQQFAFIYIVGATLSACTLLPPVPEPIPATPIVTPDKTESPVVVPTAQVPAVVAAPAVPEDVVVVNSILSDVSKALQAGGDLLRREIATATASWTREKSSANRLKLASLTAFSSAGPADDARALSLLEPWIGKSAEQNAFKAAADFLTIPLLEKQKYMRDEQRKTEAQRERADQLKKELDATQQKLEAMRELERSLSRRRTQK